MSLNATLTNKPQLPIAMSLLSRTILAITLTSITILAGTILASSTVLADDNTSVVDEINITVPVSCTISGTGMNTHNANINNGQYNSAIGETTMKAFCNDNNGFAIYAIGFTDNEDGKNVLTNSTLGSVYDIETGRAITGNDSQWAMKLSTVISPTPTYPIVIAGSTDDTDKEQGDPDYSTFQEVPDDYTLVAKRTAGTDIGTNAEGSTLKSTYQAYISKTQPAGTYTGQVKYTLVHPHSADKPQKPLYLHEIDDWRETWLHTIGDSVEAIDIRDGNTYLVSKLQDGRIWLLENLKLDPTNPIVKNRLNETNTNASSNAIHNYYHGDISNPGWTTIPVTNTIANFNTNVEPQINNSYIESISSDSMDQGNQWKTGVFYNYCAATIGTFCYESGSEYDIPDTLIDAVYDLCPANWRMPTGSSSGEYQTLLQYPGVSNYSAYRNVLRLPMSGFYASNGIIMNGEIANYWSSSFGISSGLARQIYVLNIHRSSSSVSAGVLNSQNNGQLIRCIAK